MVYTIDTILHQFMKYKYTRLILTGLLLFSVLGVGLFGYRWYRVRVQEKAQGILSEALDAYALMKYEDNHDELVRMEQMFKEGYARTKQSTLAPIFLIYAADVQSRQGKLTEAIQTMDEALRKLPKNSPFYELYQIKKLLMQIDESCGTDCQDAISHEALEQLEKIAYSPTSKYREIALQHLIDYYSAVGRTIDVQKASQELEKITQSQTHDPIGSFI